MLLHAFIWAIWPTIATANFPGYGEKIAKRRNLVQQESNDTLTGAPVVDMGYAKYEGYYDSTFDIYAYKGVRYAQKPRRWQVPEEPVKGQDGNGTIRATENPARCPQAWGGGMIAPETYSFETDTLGDEDCLFLNVMAPVNKSKLPVMVWIHGGGYNVDSISAYDFRYMAQTVGNGFTTVLIQYRLGAFGFASSADIKKFGVPNAGAHDIQFALQWVQRYIHLFGGDPDQVTIAGQSAGGGAVMLMAMANNGTRGSSLFKRAIASSPYLPTQWDYDGLRPSQAYNQLVNLSGCSTAEATPDRTAFDCVASLDSQTLQNISAAISMGSIWGQWAFLPVTDGELLVERPTAQLLGGRVNGEAILIGNNANEGQMFVPTEIDTREEFISRLKLDYPLLTDDNITAIMTLYDFDDEAATEAGGLYESNGITPPFSTSVSSVASGWLQASYNAYGETTFMCPANWLADAYTQSIDAVATGKRAWRYQFSPPPALHDDDLDVIMQKTDGSQDVDTDDANEGYTFRVMMQSIWGRFITSGDPTALADIVATATEGNGSGNVSAAVAPNWPPWGLSGVSAAGTTPRYFQLDVNVTDTSSGVANFSIVDGYSFQGGRGARCELWVALGSWTPA